VEVTACGVTRSWLLYNYGSSKKQTFAPPEPEPGPTLAGSWSGSYLTSGPGFCSDVTGSWSASFSVNAKGKLAGQWQGDGFGGTISGTLSGDTATFTVRGSGDADIVGTVTGNTVSGSFTGPECEFDVGRVTGSFSGTRAD
jgi:hypothetical protein